MAERVGEKMEININKSLYCIDRETGKKFLVDAIFFPLGKPSGKDLTVETESDLSEWRAIKEVEMIDNTKRNKGLSVDISIKDIEMFEDLVSIFTRIITDERIDKEVRQSYLDEFISNI